MAVYEFQNTLNGLIKDGSDADPQKIGDEIERVKQKNGGSLTPRQLWESQKGSRAKLHKHFEWDDEVCGEKYRDQQARTMIQSIKVVYANEAGEDREVRAFSSVKDEANKGRRVYISTEEALSNTQTRDQVLQAAINGLISWRRKWTELTECSDAIKAVDSAIDSLREEIVTKT